MIPNYTVPQATIAQVLETTTNPLLDRLHAVVVGPAYIHADAASDNLVWGDYASGVALSYLRSGGLGTGGGAVDQPNVRLYAKNLLLQLFSKGTVTGSPTTSQFKLYAPAPTGTLLHYNNTDGFMDAEDPSVVAAFDNGRAPAIGDLYRITTSEGTVDRTVRALVGQDQDASLGGYGYSGALPWTNSAADEEITVSSSTVDIGSPSFVSVSAAALLEVRKRGHVAPEGGLRLVFEAVCVSAGTGTSAVFTTSLDGISLASTNATNSSNTRFSFLTGTVVEVGGNDWSVGDRFVLFLDFANDGDLDLLNGAVDVSLLTYHATTRRVSSTLIAEVISLTDTTATLRLSDTSGLLPVSVVTVTGLGYEGDLVFDGSSINVIFTDSVILSGHVGQRYTSLILPATRSTTVFDKVLLSAPVGLEGSSSGVEVSATVPYSGLIPAEEPLLGNVNYTVDSADVTLGSIQQSVSGYASEFDSVKTAIDGSGQVAIQWRSLIPVGSTEGLFAVDTTADIINRLGSDALESELGFALSKALSGAQGKRVYGLNTGGTSREDFQAAILKLEAANYIYAIAVLTDDEDIMRDFSAHARLSSLKEIKRFRRVYVGTDSPGEYPILSVHSDSSPYLATITSGDNGYNLVTFTDAGVDLELITITRGDKLYLPGADTSYVIDRVTGPDTLVLSAGPVAAVPETSVQVIAADTAANVGRYVSGRSQRIGTSAEERRRINNVWTDNGIYDNGDGVINVIPNRFGAAEMAGLRTAIQPQQSLTRTEVSFITDAPSMYTRFPSSVLNDMAANGVWIIAQNAPDTVPFIRHQITAEVSSGSLFYEDSAGVNIDSVCFAIDDIVDPLIGKRNATSRTVIELKNALLSILNDLTESAYDSVIGPQLVNFFNALGDSGTLDVALDPVLKDTINVGVTLEIPLPLNTIRVTVAARTIRLDGGTVVNALTVSAA